MAAQKPLYIDVNNDHSVFLTGDFVDVTNGGTGAVDAAGARTNLGLALGTNVQAWDADLDAVAALASTGIPVRTGAGTWAQRTLQPPAAGLTITNPAGVAGDPTFALANDLSALEALGSTGFAVRTAADTWAQRVIATAGATRIAITNGDGVAGNPTIDLANITDSGVGTFKKITVDTFGRVTGTTAVVAADITALVDATYINVGGDTMTGFLTLNADPTNALHAVTKQYADAIGAGQRVKTSVRALGNTNVSTANPGTAVFDGVTLNNGDRLLLTGQTSPAENGPWVFNGAGAALTRPADYNTSAQAAPNDTFWVNEGTNFADTAWTLTTNGVITLGSTGLTFTQSSGLGQVVAGAGLTKTGNQLDIGTASTARIVVNADNIDLATTGVTAGTFTKITVDVYGRATAGATATPADIGAQPADSDLTALANIATTGLYAVTATGTSATRTLQAPAAGFTITNPAGVAGDPTFVLANDLAALEALAGTGIAVRTAADTWAQRQIVSAGGRISITNPAGIAGNIDVDLTSGVVTPGTYNSVTVDTYGRVTAGSVASATVDSTVVALQNNQGAATAIGRAVYTDASGTVKLAQSNAAGTSKVTGLQLDVNVNAAATGNYVTEGVVTATTVQWDAVTGQAGGLTPDAYYYLSGSTAGAITPTAPTTNYLCRIGKAVSTTKMLVRVEPRVRLT